MSTISMISNENQCEDVQSGDMDVEGQEVLSVTPATNPAPESSKTSVPVLDSFFDNKKQPCQPVLDSYPSRKMGSKERRFNKDWYNEFKWLEYNQAKDACFCFPCRVFLANSPETNFTETGFHNWKNAKGSGGRRPGKKKNGLDLHADCKSHKDAMLLWADSGRRKKQCSTIQQTVLKVSSEQQQWLFAVFNVTRYLAANGLPFRGDTEGDLEGDGKGSGLFQCAFSQLLFPLEPKWKHVYKNLPKNAQYTSSTIQNEAIFVLASLVKKKISADVRAAKIYTIMADGTTDKNRKEIQGLTCRYLSPNGEIEEHCVNI